MLLGLLLVAAVVAVGVKVFSKDNGGGTAQASVKISADTRSRYGGRGIRNTGKYRDCRGAKRKCGCSCAFCQTQPVVRKTLSDHIWWTKDVVVNHFAGLFEEDAAVQRLLRNQDEMATLLATAAPNFESGIRSSSEIFEEQADLWREHITIAYGKVKAAKSGDDATELDADWERNAKQIADALFNLNARAWAQALGTGEAGKSAEEIIEDTRNAMQAAMLEHLRLLGNQVQAIAAGDGDASVAATDASLDHMMGFADLLATAMTIPPR